MEQARQPAKDKDPLELYPQGRLLQVSAIFRIFLTVIDPFKQDGSVTEVRRTNIRPVEHRDETNESGVFNGCSNPMKSNHRAGSDPQRPSKRKPGQVCKRYRETECDCCCCATRANGGPAPTTQPDRALKVPTVVVRIVAVRSLQEPNKHHRLATAELSWAKTQHCNK